MGLVASSEEGWENPVDKVDATLYYFSGRGLADQMRWMLAAADISFTQKVISHKDQLAKMAKQQLPFGQLPLLQIDGIEIVQSQAAVRYIAKRSGLVGKTNEEELKCDMIVEAVRDLLSLVAAAPFKRCAGLTWRAVRESEAQLGKGVKDPQVESLTTPEDANEMATIESESQKPDIRAPLSRLELDNAEWKAHLALMKDKWSFMSSRFEAILRSNFRRSQKSSRDNTSQDNSKTAKSVTTEETPVFLVGEAMTYADILVAHMVTWFVEECGHEITKDTPLLVQLQHTIVSLPGVKKFLKGINYFPIGNIAYVEQVTD
jgi:glutathione S-transferase